jgi:hypothetical protein
MDPIPVFFENVKRCALILKPKKPFFDWLNSIDPIDSELTVHDDSAVYLLPDFEEKSQIQNWLKKNFDELFCDQLNNWYIDDTLWVKNRTFEMFKEWFDYSMHTMIWDTLEEPIEKI